ncbi:hypothetical protein SAMN05421762_2163 [Pseudooceanicola nitratireducens]|jgi:hypothetical protein|uniref:Uncharacterized protein n=1 Tax=Pseudooceanicola nitratireducens TaxID=517719 RepID=A0A1I1M7H1_9RHOB|nr:hypothetical protein [Pseudooceanicola nitratireducens]SEI94080.1 hypothetical protein SAMN05216183_1011177 [Pseudooceanicola nitratireducens]SFC77620.1 hypothetical protein SAMN05421762_2163 [Pseudooceanicola nitratireducens]
MAETTSTRGPRDDNDPKGLIREAYRIDGISDAECRSILMDWALSLADGASQQQALQHLVARYGAETPDHPMTQLLQEGQNALMPQGRRGGRAGRLH